MALHNFKQGELGHWLRVVSDNERVGAQQVAVPVEFIHALTTLRCVERDEQGRLVVTAKGKLALHMGGT
jgi:hypothetical protein